MNLLNETIIFLTSTVVASMLMAGLMAAISSVRVANANMILTFGSLVTRNEKTAFLPGIFLHIFFGSLFALSYVFIWRILDVSSLWAFAVSGAIIGFFHGFLVSFAIIVLIAEYHPVAAYRASGFPTAFAYVAGHTVFGSSLGLIWGYAGHMLVT